MVCGCNSFRKGGLSCHVLYPALHELRMEGDLTDQEHFFQLQSAFGYADGVDVLKLANPYNHKRKNSGDGA